MGLFQGMDAIPVEIASDPRFVEIFRAYLPGWEGGGEYNYSPGAATNKIAAQMQIPLHYGSHPWINDAIKDLFLNAELR